MSQKKKKKKKKKKIITKKKNKKVFVFFFAEKVNKPQQNTPMVKNILFLCARRFSNALNAFPLRVPALRLLQLSTSHNWQN